MDFYIFLLIIWSVSLLAIWSPTIVSWLNYKSDEKRKKEKELIESLKRNEKMLELIAIEIFKLRTIDIPSFMQEHETSKFEKRIKEIEEH